MFNFIKNKSLIIVLIIILSIWNTQTNAKEYFSSVSSLGELLKTEKEMYKNVKKYIDETKDFLELMEKEMKAIAEVHEKADKNLEKYLTNPINAYLLIKRLLIDWETYLKMVEDNKARLEFIGAHSLCVNKMSYPTEYDLEGLARAFARLQSTYQLDISHIASGILNGVKYDSAMSWEDCFQLGNQLFELQKFKETIPWMKVAFDKMNDDDLLDNDTTISMMLLISQASYELGDLNKALNITNAILEIDPSNEETIEKKILIERELSQSIEKPPVVMSYQDSKEFKIYEAICRDEIKRTPSEMRHLSCKFSHNNKPFLYLAPFKMEIISTEPEVYVFHDVISDDEIEKIKKMAEPTMMRGEVKNHDGSNAKSEVRTSQGSWLKYDMTPFLKKIQHRVSDITGLETEVAAEDLLVTNYGIAGHYEPHYDAFETKVCYTEETGNRIATAIFYLSNVEMGGSTSFPFLNINVHPEKGSLLFWYNLHKDNSVDRRMKHAGCPILIGSKWIANVWIKERQQEFYRKCDLQPDNHLSESYKNIIWY